MRLTRRHLGLVSVVGVVVGSIAALAALQPTSSTTVPSSMLNLSVTQQTIQSTICVPGWTSTIRPPASYTTGLKMAQLGDDAKYNDKDPTHYEEDHWIPLELGGAPRDYNNLWPEPWPEAHKKDAQENRLHKEVCSGKTSLTAARLEMYTKWGPR